MNFYNHEALVTILGSKKTAKKKSTQLPIDA